MSEATPSPGPRRRSKFPRTFYVANVMEIFERMAWYGFFAVSSLYITSPVTEGGLGFSSMQRGVLQGIIPFLLYLLPVITGALADRYGYKRTFLVAFSIMTPAYLLLGQANRVHEFTGLPSFPVFFVFFLLVAVGAATFKPVVVGTVGRTTDDTNRGLGFGVFYTIVNIGGFFGPLVAGYVRAMSWDLVFVMSAVWIGLNFLPTLFAYQEPTDEAGKEEKRSLLKVLTDAQDVLGNGRFALIVVPILVFMMIAGGGWFSQALAAQGVLTGEWSKLGLTGVDWAIVGGFSVLWIGANLAWNAAVPGEDTGQSWFRQRARIGNWPFVLYLLILAGFWASFNQIFITLPEYIRDFVETGNLVDMAAAVGPWAVDFLASVNVDSVATWITTAVNEHGAIEVGATSHDLFYELVHLKVRVPEEVIAAEISRLATLGADPAAVEAVARAWAEEYRQINPEYLINLDAGAIVIFQILVSWVIERWKPFPVLVVGTIVAGTGIALGSIAVTGMLTVLAILVFAFGEMIASPKSQEYVARIAPGDKVALFMGYYFVSVALGNLFGGILSGVGYEVLARDLELPEVMWLVFGGVGFLTAGALLVFNKFVVPRLEAQRETNSAEAVS